MHADQTIYSQTLKWKRCNNTWKWKQKPATMQTCSRTKTVMQPQLFAPHLMLGGNLCHQINLKHKQELCYKNKTSSSLQVFEQDTRKSVPASAFDLILHPYASVPSTPMRRISQNNTLAPRPEKIEMWIYSFTIPILESVRNIICSHLLEECLLNAKEIGINKWEGKMT